jgi:hypothetical protein
VPEVAFQPLHLATDAEDRSVDGIWFRHPSAIATRLILAPSQELSQRYPEEGGRTTSASIQMWPAGSPGQ